MAADVVLRNGRFSAVGREREVMAERGAGTRVIDLGGRVALPGLNDSHTHTIRGGLNFNLELRWDGVPSLADALRRLREQAQRHATAAVGARGRRLERVPIRRAPPADAAGAERSGARDAGLRALPVQHGAAQRRGAARRRQYQGHAESAGRRSVRDTRAGPEARPRGPGELDAPLHARAEPPGPDERDRRRRRLSELPRRLPGRRGAVRAEAAHAAHRVQPVHAAAQAGARRTSGAGRAWRGRGRATATTA